MNTNAIRAGRAFVELFADDTKLVRGLRAAERKLRAFGASISRIGRQMAGLGAALLTPLVAAGKAFSNMGDDIAKMSKRTGMSVESLSAMSFAAQQSGTSIEDFEKGVRKMQRTIVDAGMGSKSAADAMGVLGLSYQQLARLSPEEQFKLIADRLSKIKDPTTRAAIAMMIFGRSGTALLPMLEKGAVGIQELTDEAGRLGLMMKSQDAAAAEELNDAFGRMWQVVKMTSYQIGAALAPTLTKLSNWVAGVIAKFNAWIDQNRQVIVTVAKVATSILAGGIALMVFGGMISGLGMVLGKLATTIVFIGTVFKTLGAAILFLTQPIVLVIAALAALGATLLYVTGTGAQALQWLGTRFGQLKQDAVEAFGAIGDALAAGDIALAARILWLTLKMEWTRGINFLEKMWLNFRNFFIRLAYDAFSGALAAATYAWYGLEIGWTETVSFLQKVWNGFSSFFSRTWERMKAIATKAYLWIMSLFDDSINLEAAYQIVDDEKQKAIDKINQEQQSRGQEIESRRQSRNEDSQKMRDTMLNEIGTDYVNRNKQLDDEYNQRINENTTELQEARKAWRDSLNEAKKKRSEKDRLGTPAAPGYQEPDLSGLGGLFDAAAAKMTAAGGFSGFGRFGVEGDSAAERTANGVEQIAKNTKELLNTQRDSEETVV